VAYIGGGVINEAMARATDSLHKFEKGFVFGLDTKQSETFAANVTRDCSYEVEVKALSIILFLFLWLILQF